jgi:hypothetical protein
MRELSALIAIHIKPAVIVTHKAAAFVHKGAEAGAHQVLSIGGGVGVIDITAAAIVLGHRSLLVIRSSAGAGKKCGHAWPED